jgi:hypothetical protein
MIAAYNVKKKSPAKPTPLQLLPTVDHPNQCIHIDLFGPLKTSAQGNKMVLIMTDVFTKYADCNSGQASRDGGHGDLYSLDLQIQITSANPLR